MGALVLLKCTFSKIDVNNFNLIVQSRLIDYLSMSFPQDSRLRPVLYSIISLIKNKLECRISMELNK